jgi:hypothetical protein
MHANHMAVIAMVQRSGALPVRSHRRTDRMPERLSRGPEAGLRVAWIRRRFEDVSALRFQ